MTKLPTFIVHDFAQARAALTAAAEFRIAVRLQSAAGAAGFAGAAWFVAMIKAARAAVPDAESQAVLDCGREPGFALAAIRAGNEAIRLTASTAVREKIAAIAAARGCRLVTGPAGPRLDLLDAPDPERAARKWLAAKAGKTR